MAVGTKVIKEIKGKCKNRCKMYSHGKAIEKFFITLFQLFSGLKMFHLYTKTIVGAMRN
jgi:hypothetical protein